MLGNFFTFAAHFLKPSFKETRFSSGPREIFGFEARATKLVATFSELNLSITTIGSNVGTRNVA